MTKLKVVTSDKKSGAEQVHQSKEALVEQLADMLSEILPETDDFQEFENAALEVGNELVRRTLKKTEQHFRSV